MLLLGIYVPAPFVVRYLQHHGVYTRIGVGHGRILFGGLGAIAKIPKPFGTGGAGTVGGPVGKLDFERGTTRPLAGYERRPGLLKHGDRCCFRAFAISIGNRERYLVGARRFIKRGRVFNLGIISIAEVPFPGARISGRLVRKVHFKRSTAGQHIGSKVCDRRLRIGNKTDVAAEQANKNENSLFQTLSAVFDVKRKTGSAEQAKNANQYIIIRQHHDLLAVSSGPL